MKKISVVLATYNEGSNLKDCLISVKDFASEIIVVDGGSEDSTVEIAKELRAKVIETTNPPIFHINKQKAIDATSGDWILQMDADERVTKDLAKEIIEVINMTSEELENYQKNIHNRQLFLRHQKLIEQRDGRVGDSDGEYTAFFFPRLNYFLGKYLKYGGVYPDGVIRLFKKGKAYLPCKDVHEQMVVNGRVGWLQHDLLHMADPTFKRYLQRNNRYIDLIRDELQNNKVGKNPLQALNYLIIKPILWFLLTQIRHKGVLDGFPGIVFSFFSALRFPRAYFRYLKR